MSLQYETMIQGIEAKLLNNGNYYTAYSDPITKALII